VLDLALTRALVGVRADVAGSSTVRRGRWPQRPENVTDTVAPTDLRIVDVSYMP
jgi:hypothetical protein